MATGDKVVNLNDLKAVKDYEDGEIDALKSALNTEKKNEIPALSKFDSPLSLTFVQGAYENGAVAVGSKRICAYAGFMASGTKLHIVCNGQCFNLHSYEKPLDGTTQSAPEKSGWIGGNITYNYTIQQSGYIALNIATATSYSSSSDITPSDYAMVITINTEQAIAITNNASGIQNAHNDLISTSDYLSKDVTKTDSDWAQGGIDANGEVVSSTKYIYKDYGLVPKGEIFKVVCNGQYHFIAAFSKPIGSANNTKVQSTQMQGGNYTFTTEIEEASYVVVVCAKVASPTSSDTISPSDYAMEIYLTSNVCNEINLLKQDISNYVFDFKVIEDNKLLRNAYYGYASASGLSNPQRTPMIPCTPGMVFKYFGRSDYDFAAVYWKNASKTNIGKDQTGHAVGEYTFTAPENAYYCEFSSYGTPNFNVYPQGQKEVGNIKHLIDTTLSNVNPLSGKNLLFVGDSITQGVGYNGGWVTLVQSRNNCTCANEGHGGWPIGNSADAESHYNTLAALIGRLTGSYDYIILSGGYNDFTTSPRATVGELTPYTYSELTRNTFAGDLEYYIRTARNNWLTAKIGYILTMKKEFGNAETEARQVQYWDIIRNACKKYSIPLLDLYNASGLVGVQVSGVVDEVTKKYYHATEAAPNGDGTHPNNDGYAYLIQRVEDFVKGL